jgi:predicted anti-sigma-YlaC factor YlaD
MANDTELGNKGCAKYEALLEDYLEGALSAAGSKGVEEHWRNCAACRSALDEASASVGLLRRAGPTEGPGPAFARTVMARIRELEQERSAERAGFWQPLVSLGWRFAATATLALGVLVTYDAGWGHRAQPDATTTRLIAMSDLFAPDPARPPADRDEVLMMVAETKHEK